MDKEKLNQIVQQYEAQYAPIFKQYEEACELVELAKLGLEPKMPKPTHFTIKEGGEWIGWHDRGFSNTKVAQAIKFEDGTIFDMINGWRTEKLCVDEGCPNQPIDHVCIENEKLVPRYEDQSGHITGQDKQSQPGDYRVVPRVLLEHCLCTFDNIKKLYMNSNWDIKDQTDLHVAFSKLKAALQTEKSELKASIERRETYDPNKVCGSFSSSFVDGRCRNCGYTKPVHDDWVKKQSQS